MDALVASEPLRTQHLARVFLAHSDVRVIGSRKYGEAYLWKRAGGRHKERCLNKCASCCG